MTGTWTTTSAICSTEAKRQREAIKEASSAAAKAERKALAEAAAKPKIKVASSGVKRQLEQLEARMAVLNGEGASLEGLLSKSPPPSDYAELGNRLKAVNDELQLLEEQWLTLSGLVEAAAVSH